MGQQISLPQGTSPLQNCKLLKRVDISHSITNIQHESFLKLRPTPFRNSIKISESPLLFLEHYQISFTRILSERMGGTKLFTEEDIRKLIETCLYGFAHLQNSGMIYKDITTDNIFYNTEEGTFKLLPNQLIEQSSYELVQQEKKFRSLSPEMILSLRANQQTLDSQILSKSNVFMLGMILLESCTLKASSDCYDGDNFDLLHMEIEERLEMVKEFYPKEVYELLSLMIEYDYTERLNSQKLANYVNQYLQKLDIKEFRHAKYNCVKRAKYKQQPDIHLQNHKFEQRSITKTLQGRDQPLKPILQNYDNQLYQQCKQIAKHSCNNPYYYKQQDRETIQRNKSIYSPYLHQYKNKTYNPYLNPDLNYENQVRHRSPINDNKNSCYIYNQNQSRSPARRKQASQQYQSRHPSTIYQSHFTTGNNVGGSNEESIFQLRQQIEKSRIRIQQFDRSYSATKSYK